MINNAVVKEGRKCPKCGEVGEKDFASCMGCGYDFLDSDPIVGFDADGMIVEINGKAVAPTKELPTTAAPATVVATVTAAPGPDQPTQTAAPPPAATTTPVAVTKRVSIDVVVDESPRETRPAPGTPDFVAAPKADPVTYDLTKDLLTFGGLNSFNLPPELFFLLSGDEAVSRQHGKFYRMADGGYQVENLSKGCPIFIRQGNILVAVGDKVTLDDGMELEIGDWYTITIHVHPV